MRQNKHGDQDRGALLSVAAFSATVIAYLLAFTVLTDPDMASRFENGVAPAGAYLACIRAAAIASIVAALGAWTPTPPAARPAES